MTPLSDAGMPHLNTDWQYWLKNSTLADKSEDSDTIRARLEEMEQPNAAAVE